jgi:lipopolysaccharide/colanic/teichoic acid biosynthesis glycosyltransferase
MRAVPSSFAHHGRRLLITDVVVVLAAPYIALALRGVEWSAEAAVALIPYWALGALFSLIFLVQFRIGQILPSFMSRRDVTQIIKMAATAAAFSSVTAFSVWRLELIPRSLPILHLIVLIGMLAGWRSIVGAFERRRQSVVQPGQRVPRVSILIIGVGPTASLFIRLLKSLNDVRPNIVGLLDDDLRLHGRSIDGHLILGGVDRFEAVVAELASHGVTLQRVLIAHLDLAQQQAAREALEGPCAERGIALEALSERLGLLTFDTEAVEESVRSTYALSKTRAQKYLAFRRYADAALAFLALVALSPIIALVALAIRVRLGAPVTFWQQRVGVHGEPIVVHKFRTFAPAVDATGRLLSDDERSSALGRFLRACRLDELPQLFDVLRDHMSLIGPRPLLPVDLAEDCSIRLSVVPGLTGWAQVHGGKSISADEKNALDEWYVYHASFGLDLRIILRTLRIVFRGDTREDDAMSVALAFRAKRLREEEAERVKAPARPISEAAEKPQITGAKAEESARIVEFPRPANSTAGNPDPRTRVNK